MERLLAFLLGIALTHSVVAECMATAYRAGDPIPTYLVLAHRTLVDEWSRYKAQYAESAQLTYLPSAEFAVRPLLEQCLVEFAPIDEQGQVQAAGREELILQRPCDEFRSGNVRRLIVYAYCVELFGQNPDFFSTLPYRHAKTTNRERY
jgi:hypothetical protein